MQVQFNYAMLFVRKVLTLSLHLVLLFFFLNVTTEAKTVEYDLTIELKPMNFTGKEVEAMTINGDIPGPTLHMTEGDDVKVRVHNKMDVETSIHWHGILLPNKEDGVPYLTTPPIRPGTMREFNFPIIQSGTYWYHSHTGLQEQRGVYGSIVIKTKKERFHVDRDYVLVLSDWTNEAPMEVLRTLKRGSEYYVLKKGSMQSLTGAIQADALKETFQRSLIRMPPMDISDIAYDAFLANGHKKTTFNALPGEKIRLRVINASASTYFYIQFSGGKMEMVSADGLDVKPVPIERLLIAVAETYDFILTMPDEEGSYEFRATAQDGSGHTSAYLGSGSRRSAPDVPKPNLYKMHGGMSGGHGRQMEMTMDHHNMATMKEKMHMPMERPLAPYEKLRAVEPTSLPGDNPVRTIILTLTGDMKRYVWSFDNKILSESDKILVRRGENLRIKLVNKTMMHHPLHLHGHFFRVLNGQGEYAPMKHTVDISPLGAQTIEFHANENKDWFFHCHILYHMKVGMARVIHYEGSEVDPEIAEARKEPTNFLNKDPWFFWGDISLLTQMNEGMLELSNTRNIFSAVWEHDWEEEYDVEITYDRYFNRFFRAFAGTNKTDKDTRGILGIRYLLPLNFESLVWIDTEGEFRFSLEKEIQITSRLAIFMDAEYDTEEKWEWVAGSEWIFNKYLSIIAQYHSDFEGGVGLTIRF